MEPYEVLITKTGYDKDDNETAEIVFGPRIIFAHGKDSVVKKAAIESGISSDDVNEVNFYVKKYE